MSENKEIEKPIVPQYVADWYEENKDSFENKLAYLIADYFDGTIEDDNLWEWLGGFGGHNLATNKPIETLVKMKLFGYDVK